MNVVVDVKNLDNWVRGLQAVSVSNVRTQVIRPVFDLLGTLLTASISEEFSGDPFEYKGRMKSEAPGKFAVVDDGDSLEIYEPMYYGKFLRRPTGPRGKWLYPVYVWALRKIWNQTPEDASDEAKANARYITTMIMNHGVGYSKHSPLWDAYPEGQLGFDYPTYVTWIKDGGRDFYEAVEFMRRGIPELIDKAGGF